MKEKKEKAQIPLMFRLGSTTPRLTALITCGIEGSSAGIQEVVATELKDYTFMLLPDEIAGPIDKLGRLQKAVMRFVKEAEEQMNVKVY